MNFLANVQNFDAEQAQADSSSSIPRGDYPSVITYAEIEHGKTSAQSKYPNSDKTTLIIEVDLVVGQTARSLKEYITFEHSMADQDTDIKGWVAGGQLKVYSLLVATGLLEKNLPENQLAGALVGQQIMTEVANNPKKQYPNSIKSFSPKQQPAYQQQQQQQPVQQQQGGMMQQQPVQQQQQQPVQQGGMMQQQQQQQQSMMGNAMNQSAPNSQGAVVNQTAESHSNAVNANGMNPFAQQAG